VRGARLITGQNRTVVWMEDEALVASVLYSVGKICDAEGMMR
jgi:hypothetical protein